MMRTTLGTLVYSFFIDHLAAQRGLRPATIRSYRDTLRLFLIFVATDARRRITQLSVEDLTFERVLDFLQHLEAVRHNHVPTRNQRLTGLRTFFEYLGRRLPEQLHVCERVRRFRPNARRCRRCDSWIGRRSRRCSRRCLVKVGRRSATAPC